VRFVAAMPATIGSISCTSKWREFGRRDSAPCHSKCVDVPLLLCFLGIGDSLPRAVGVSWSNRFSVRRGVAAISSDQIFNTARDIPEQSAAG
jgi:hypothetical protein